MLMEGRHNTNIHIRAERDGGAAVDGGRGQDASSLDLVVESCCLVEVPHEYVLVVSDCNNGLQDENARAHDGDSASAGVGVFPADAVVNFVHTNCVRLRDWVALRIGDYEGEVLCVVSLQTWKVEE